MTNETYYTNKLESLHKEFEKIKLESHNNRNEVSKMKENFLELKTIFSQNYNQVIADLEYIISSSDNTNKDKDKEIEESPAAKPKITWHNGTLIYTHEKTQQKYIHTSENVLPSKFTVSMRIVKHSSVGYLSLGLYNEKMDGPGGWLGGDTGKGTWGINSNKAKGEEGKWNTGGGGLGFKEGDVFTINGDNGVITYSVNDKEHKDYKYDLKTTELYLAVTSHYKGDSVEIIN